MPKSKNQEHLTPDRVFDLIEEKWNFIKSDFYDPCPQGTPFRSPCFFNGLYGDWQDLNYVNCPFEKETLEKFVEKSIEQKQKGKITIMLLPTKTDQDWFHKFIIPRLKDVLWIRKRLKFKNNKNHATDTHFLVLIN